MVKFFKIFFISIVFALLLDFFLGKLVLKKLDKFLLETEFYERLIRINYPIYHHTFAPNVDYKYANGINFTYRLCTNNHGFKSKCNSIVGKKFDVAFIGDSFVEGGLEYEKSFCVMFSCHIFDSYANSHSCTTKCYRWPSQKSGRNEDCGRTWVKKTGLKASGRPLDYGLVWS